MEMAFDDDYDSGFDDDFVDFDDGPDDWDIDPDDWDDDGFSDARPSRPRRKKRGGWVLPVAVCALAAVGLGLFALKNAGEKREEAAVPASAAPRTTSRRRRSRHRSRPPRYCPTSPGRGRSW